MDKNRRDHTRFLMIGFAASLVIGILFFALSAAATVHDTKKLIEEAQISRGEPSGKENQPDKPDEGETKEAEATTEEAETTTEPESTEPQTTQEVYTTDAEYANFNDGAIQALTAEEIAAIEGSTDTSQRGFGTGFTDPKNELGRPSYVTSVEEDMKNAGINGRCFCADADTKKASITFQAGYESGHTEQILMLLAQNSVKSTFYVTHEYGWNNPELLQKIIDQGHEIGNHSYSAPEEGIATKPLQYQMDDALRMQSYMEENYGYTMRKYNYNSGVFTLASAKMMSEMGYEVCFCSVNYDDFSETTEFDANSILNSLLSCAHNGVVYCFHINNKVTAEILPGLIYYLRSEGYEIVQMP